jgi:hypothetical protein
VNIICISSWFDCVFGNQFAAQSTTRMIGLPAATSTSVVSTVILYSLVQNNNIYSAQLLILAWPPFPLLILAQSWMELKIKVCDVVRILGPYIQEPLGFWSGPSPSLGSSAAAPSSSTTPAPSPAKDIYSFPIHALLAWCGPSCKIRISQQGVCL